MDFLKPLAFFRTENFGIANADLVIDEKIIAPQEQSEDEEDVNENDEELVMETIRKVTYEVSNIFFTFH